MPPRWRPAAAVATAVMAAGALLTACGPSAPTPTPQAGSGPHAAYDCAYDPVTEAYAGAFATASAIGWEGNHEGVVTCLGGTFYVQDGINRNFGFGIYDGEPTTWTLADGYLPAQITTFTRDGATVAITEFADKVTIGGDAFVVVYSRVQVHNGSGRVVEADPEASPGLVPLATAPDAVTPHTTVDHDYALAVDRFGQRYAWPSAAALAGAGGYASHLAHMRGFWDQQLAGIAEVTVPDRALDDAYRSGFIYTQIARSGDHLNTGVNGYASEFSHDVVGILAGLFTQGYFTDAHALLLEARTVVGAQGQYLDGEWTYAWPWAIYLLKTGDVAFVKKYFAAEGPEGDAQPSIKDTAQDIAADRTGPGGIMEPTDDIDADGYWTIDDYEALMGLAAYRYVAQRVGDSAEATWATAQYDSLLAATNATLKSTITTNGLTYLPCSMVQPNTANRCANPEDANWAAPLQFGKWAWDGQLFGATVSGPGLDLIDATYDYGFSRLDGVLPGGTYGGYPPDYFSTAYDAGYGSWGLASQDHRDQGILGYEFMIADTQSGPDSWWESAGAPSTDSAWTGSHPATGQGSSPHAWGMAEANKVLLDSLVAQRADGSLIVGRGVPDAWLARGRRITVTDFPTTDGKRLGVTVSSRGTSVSLSLTGSNPPGQVLFELPAFVDNLASVSTGSMDAQSGTVTLSSRTRRVTVELDHAPAGS